jgi:hypothetical protein
MHQISAMTYSGLAVPVKEFTIEREGAQLIKAALSARQLRELESVLGAQPTDHAGVRLFGIPALRPFLCSDGPVGKIPALVLGPNSLAIRAVLFDKSAEQNWSLGWHQDRTIAVRERIDVDGFGPWSVKSGTIHVEPPFELLAGMLTVRVHLDPVSTTNAPLLIAPGSQKRGRIPTEQIPDVVHQCGIIQCLAEAGDVWLYATPILHASNRASEPLHRRVLQVDYAAGELPSGLEWQGI